MKHIYKKNEHYYLGDMDKMKFYKMDESMYPQLNKLNESEIDEFANNLFKDITEKANLNIKATEEGKCERLILNLTDGNKWNSNK